MQSHFAAALEERPFVNEQTVLDKDFILTE
jgi:hypothetical protein